MRFCAESHYTFGVRHLRPTRFGHRRLALRLNGAGAGLVHRRNVIRLGRLQGDELACGYHGLTFDCSGACVRAPGIPLIPKGAVVRSYPIAERYGFVWIWMGDAALADPSSIMQVEHWGDPAWGVNRGNAMTIQCNYLYVTDNLLDPSHVSWVHQTSFGNAAMVGQPLQVDVRDEGVTVSRWMRDVEVAPFYAKFVRFSGNCGRKQQYEVRFPSYALIKAIFTPAGAAADAEPFHPDVFLMDSYNFMTPVNADTTRYYWFQMRNFSPDDENVSHQFSQDVRHAFEEDRVILTAVHAGMAKNPSKLNLPLDSGPLRFRRKLAQMIDAEQSGTQADAVLRNGAEIRKVSN